MLKQILVPALGALSLGITAIPAFAQQPTYAPPAAQPQYQQQYQAQPQANPACVRLESQLASLDSQGGGADPQRQQVEAAYNQQRQQMDAMIARSRGMGCGRNFLFGPRPPAECRGLEDQIDRVRDQVERLEDQLRRRGGDAGLREARRRDLIAALAQYQCGPQYQAAAPQQQQRGGGGLFGLLFGNRGGGSYREDYPQDYQQVPQTSTYRTVCVRTCDGFFFPVSYSTVQSRFPQDENMCRRTCPGTEAIMFSYPNPGGTIEQATSTSGQPYTSLPNAFKYQTEFVKDCSCKPQGMTWEQALAGADDETVQSGDIIVDEHRSRAMSQPEGGAVVTPDEAARAAQDSAVTVTNEGVTEAPANTEPPPGLDDYGTQPAERAAVPYYVPPAARAPQQQQPQAAPQQAPPQRQDPRYLPPQFR